MFGIVGLSLGVFSNIIGMLRPEVIAVASQYTVEQKVKAYSQMMIFFVLLPAMFTLFCFKLYEWSVNTIQIVPQRRKKISMFKSEKFWRFK